MCNVCTKHLGHVLGIFIQITKEEIFSGNWRTIRQTSIEKMNECWWNVTIFRAGSKVCLAHVSFFWSQSHHSWTGVGVGVDECSLEPTREWGFEWSLKSIAKTSFPSQGFRLCFKYSNRIGLKCQEAWRNKSKFIWKQYTGMRTEAPVLPTMHRGRQGGDRWLRRNGGGEQESPDCWVRAPGICPSLLLLPGPRIRAGGLQITQANQRNPIFSLSLGRSQASEKSFVFYRAPFGEIAPSVDRAWETAWQRSHRVPFGTLWGRGNRLSEHNWGLWANLDCCRERNVQIWQPKYWLNTKFALLNKRTPKNLHSQPCFSHLQSHNYDQYAR